MGMKLRKSRSRKKDFINKTTNFLRKFLLINGILTFLQKKRVVPGIHDVHPQDS